MSMETTITGNIAEPQLKFTSAGKAVLEVRVNATRRTKNRETGEWADDGAQLWVSATFWENEAEKLAEILHKGSKVTVSGGVVMEEYQKRDGGRGQKLLIRNPRFLGVLPKASNRPQEARTAANTPDPYQTPTNDPWGAPGAGGGFDMENSGTYGTERAPF